MDKGFGGGHQSAFSAFPPLTIQFKSSATLQEVTQSQASTSNSGSQKSLRLSSHLDSINTPTPARVSFACLCRQPSQQTYILEADADTAPHEPLSNLAERIATKKALQPKKIPIEEQQMEVPQAPAKVSVTAALAMSELAVVGIHRGLLEEKKLKVSWNRHSE